MIVFKYEFLDINFSIADVANISISTKYKKNEDLIGRVPVQVKGHRSENVENDKIKFGVDLESIKKFFIDGGVVFFVVYITHNSEKAYYNSLLPLDLARLIKKYDQQKTVKIEFKSIPTEEKEMADIFLDFIRNKKKQLGTLVSDFLYIEDIEDIKNEIKKLKFGYSTVEPKSSIPFKELTTRDIYVYLEPKGIGNPIPIDKISEAIVSIQHKLEISVKRKVYYKDSYVQWKNGIPSIRCGRGIRISIPYLDIDKTEYINFSLKIDFRGTVNERIRDLCFIRDMLENKEFAVNNSIISFKNFNFEGEFDLYERINRLKLLKQRLKYYGVKTDLNLDEVTEEDSIKLSFIMEKNPSIKKYNLNIDISKSGLFKMRIANILVILMIEVDEQDKCYKLKDFFTNSWETTYLLNKDRHIPISQFLILDKEGLLADNIDSKIIIKDIKKYHNFKNKNIEYVNKFLLQAIKAYDENNAQQKQLRYLIENLSEWLYEQLKEDYVFLNLAQVRYRLRKLTKLDMDKLISIRNKHHDNIEMLVGVSILLDEKVQARHLLSKMGKEQKELFKQYPIYNLLK